MATLYTADLIDDLTAAVDTARDAAQNSPRWTNAINTAWSWLLEQDELTYDLDRHELAVHSPSGNTYHANGTCQCKAFEKDAACWHRAAARLVRRALERRPIPAFAMPTDEAVWQADEAAEMDAIREEVARQERYAAAVAGVAELFA